MNGAPRVSFFTLGCKLNQYETDAIAAEFKNDGWTVLESSDEADVFVVNTCTVTDRADRKSRNIVNRVHRHLDHAELVVVTGCFATSPDALKTRAVLESDSRVLVIENSHKNTIPAMVRLRLSENPSLISIPEAIGDPFGFKPGTQGFHTRATLKIQDGCDNFCAYCVIPTVRGPAVSRPFEAICAEFESLLRLGFREIVLTGVNMGAWRFGRRDFSSLVEALLELNHDRTNGFRIRLSSLEPEGMDNTFINLFKHPSLCPSLHLCLQSGSDKILEAMERRYRFANFKELVGRLRSVDPLFTLSTDIITGFPTETEEDFKASLRAITDLAIHHTHVFPYSRRRGTQAELLPGQVSEYEKRRRADLVRREDPSRQRSWLERFVGSNEELLVERAAVDPVSR